MLLVRISLTAAVVGLILAATTATAQPPAAQTASSESVALLPLEGQRMDPTLVKICSELLTDHLGTYAKRRLITSSDIQAMLSLEEQKMALACEDQASCIAEIGGALGVDELIRASLSRLGSKLIVSMTRIHVQQAKVLNRATIKIENNEDLYDDALKSAVLELYPPAAQAAASAATPPKPLPEAIAQKHQMVVETMQTPVADGGPDLVEWTVMSMGAGAIAAGAVFGVFASGKASEARNIGGQLAVEEAKEMAQIANFLYGFGGLGITAGLAMWYFGDDEPDNVAVTPVITPNAAFLSIRGSLP
jgi:hypothetical protein